MKRAALDIALDRGGLLEMMKNSLIVISFPPRVRDDRSPFWGRGGLFSLAARRLSVLRFVSGGLIRTNLPPPFRSTRPLTSRAEWRRPARASSVGPARTGIRTAARIMLIAPFGLVMVGNGCALISEIAGGIQRCKIKILQTSKTQIQLQLSLVAFKRRHR